MKDTCTVINKSAGRVVYNIPQYGRVTYAPHEKRRNVKVEELEKLMQQPGGKRLFYNYLYVDDKEIVRYLINGKEAPEYWLTEEKIPEWMNTCSLPEFQDALDFAPDGTKDLIKKVAVETKLNDYSKRQAIKEQLGYDVTLAIENSGEETENHAAAPSKRRVAISDDSTEEAPHRRVAISAE